jgi:acetamidase/formamidase
MDIRHLTVGSTVWLPVHVDGAKLSAGDMHAAQGDGEVCGTAIETWGKAVLGIRLRRDMQIRFPQFRTQGPLEQPTASRGWHCTTGIGPDLKMAAADAITDMIDYLGMSFHLSPSEAYVLCSVTVDLRIAEIVDKPNWVVTACLPMSIFVGDLVDARVSSPPG